MRVTRRQLRRMIREALEADRESVPSEIQKEVDKLNKRGISATAVYDEESGEWRVEEYQ